MTRLPRWLLESLIIAFLFFGTVRALGAETAAGQIKSIDLHKQVMVLTADDGQEWTLHLYAGVVVRPHERESPILESLFSASPANNAPDPVETQFAGSNLEPRVEYNYKLCDLRAGDRVIVTFDDEEDECLATEIRLLRP